MQMDETQPILWNFNSPDFLSDPYPWYRRLRTEDPVHHSPWGDWYVARFADVAMVLSDRRFCGRSPNNENPLLASPREGTAFDRMVAKWVVFMDPPGHTRLRGLLARYFSSERIKSLGPAIQTIVDNLLDDARDAGSMDIVADLAHPLPAMVISDLLGMPATDHLMFKGAFQQVTQAVDRGEAEDGEGAAATVLTDYIRDLVAERRRRPRDDMISFLIAAEGGDEGIREDELLPTCIFLLWAGHETTKNLIGNGLLSLLRHPGEMDTLKRNPALIDNAVEEFLRFESPVQKFFRWTTTDVRIGGKTIPRDQFVVGLIGGAHRDPERFDDPDRFDIGRNVGTHLAFGRGPHHCLGNLLARIEARAAVNTILRRTRDLELRTEKVEWVEAASFRSLKGLPVNARFE